MSDERQGSSEIPGIPTFRQVVGGIPGFILRVVLPAAALVILFSLPFGEVLRPELLIPAEIAFIAFWSVAFVLFLRWQVKTIHSSERPEVRWFEALIVLGVLFVAVFARLYRILSLSAPDSFSEPLSLIDSWFYTLGTLSTAGTGDLAPKGDAAKVLTMVQMVANFAFIGLLVRVLASAARRARAQRDARGAEDPRAT